jgi:hypothetical protein
MSEASIAPLRPYVAAVLRKLVAEAASYAVDASGEHVGVEPELRDEAIAGVDGRNRDTASDGGAQGSMLADSATRHVHVGTV